MADDPRQPAASRRAFLKATALGGAAVVAKPRAGRAAPDAAARAGAAVPPPAPVGSLFSAEERSALAALADLVLPGAGAWGAASYIEGLLTIFDSDPPRLYAGPPGAGEDWLPLDRVRERAWRLRIFGSPAVESPNETLVGPVRGLRPRMLDGARDAAAHFADGASPEWVWWRLPGDFRETFTELVLEGSLGDPIYGGNREAAAWRAFHFEGAMLGYGSYRPPGHAHGGEAPAPGEGEGPDPLGPFTRAALFLLGFFSRRIA